MVLMKQPRRIEEGNYNDEEIRPASSDQMLLFTNAIVVAETAANAVQANAKYRSKDRVTKLFVHRKSNPKVSGPI